MYQYFEVLLLFEASPQKGRTIRQIGKELKKSYGWAHAACTTLIHEGILTSERVGASVRCEPNFRNELTQALLAVASVHRKQKALEERAFAAETQEILTHLPSSVATVFYHEGTWHATGSAHTHITQLGGIKVTWHATRDVTIAAFAEAVVVYGQQAFWRIAGSD